MITLHKAIKYFATFFAFLIIAVIISSAIGGLEIMYSTFGSTKTGNPKDYITTEIDGIPEKLIINAGSSSLTIEEGETFSVKTNNDRVKILEENGTLYIREQQEFFRSGKNSYEIILYIPHDTEFEKTDISGGAGKIVIDGLASQNMNLDLGAGMTLLKNISVSDSTHIKGGAGQTTILDSSIKNLSLNLGVGLTDITALLTGKNKINCGVGEVKINLTGKKDDYEIFLEKGIGSASIAGENIQHFKGSDEGQNKKNIIEISGGIGRITVDFKGN